MANSSFENIIKEMAQEENVASKIKGAYVKAREIVTAGMRTREVNETHIKIAVTHLYEENQAKIKEFKILVNELSKLIKPREFKDYYSLLYTSDSYLISLRIFKDISDS